LRAPENPKLLKPLARRPADSSSEDTLSDLAAVELQPGHTVEFGVSRISSGHIGDQNHVDEHILKNTNEMH
jgi:hypothetical protein